MTSPSLIGVFVDANRTLAWAFDAAGEVIDHSAVTSKAVECGAHCKAHLEHALGEWYRERGRHCPTLISGAIGGEASIFPRVPFSLDSIEQHVIHSDGVHVVPPLMQNRPPAYARGIETLLFGIEQSNGLVCAPLAVTAHFVLTSGRVTELSTEPTPAFLSTLIRDQQESFSNFPAQKFSESVFVDWVEQSLDTENSVSAHAASAAVRLGQLNAEFYECALSAILIGADVAAHYDPGDEIVLLADEPNLEMYGLALDALGAEVLEYSAIDCMSDGLWEIADVAGLLPD